MAPPTASPTEGSTMIIKHPSKLNKHHRFIQASACAMVVIIISMLTAYTLGIDSPWTSWIAAVCVVIAMTVVWAHAYYDIKEQT